MNTIPKTLIAALVASASASYSPFALAQTDAPPATAPVPPPAGAGVSAAPDNVSTSGLDMGGTTPPTGTGMQKDEAKASDSENMEKEYASPLRGSILILDQSATTQTAHLEPTPQQSYIPVYEWWISFRPRYYLSEKVYVAGRLDYTKEFTNSGETTKYREDVFGDTWLMLGYETKVPAISKGTKVSVTAVSKLPTSKESQSAGIYFWGGASAGIKQNIPLRGESAPSFNELRLGASVLYQHPFSRATTPTNQDFGVARQDTLERSFISDQVRGTPLVNHSIGTILSAGLQITPKLSLSLTMYLINDYHYNLKDGSVGSIGGSTAPVTTTPGYETNHTVGTWFLSSLDYDLFDELALGIGYYNRANELAPDGTRRGIISAENVWWSPDARVFFDVTLNLDKIYDFATGKKKTDADKKAAQQHPMRVPAGLGGQQM